MTIPFATLARVFIGCPCPESAIGNRVGSCRYRNRRGASLRDETPSRQPVSVSRQLTRDPDATRVHQTHAPTSDVRSTTCRRRDGAGIRRGKHAQHSTPRTHITAQSAVRSILVCLAARGVARPSLIGSRARTRVRGRGTAPAPTERPTDRDPALSTETTPNRLTQHRDRFSLSHQRLSEYAYWPEIPLCTALSRRPWSQPNWCPRTARPHRTSSEPIPLLAVDGALLVLDEPWLRAELHPPPSSAAACA